MVLLVVLLVNAVAATATAVTTAVLPENDESHDEEYTAVVIEKRLKNMLVRSLVVVVGIILVANLFTVCVNM